MTVVRRIIRVAIVSEGNPWCACLNPATARSRVTRARSDTSQRRPPPVHPRRHRAFLVHVCGATVLTDHERSIGALPLRNLHALHDSRPSRQLLRCLKQATGARRSIAALARQVHQKQINVKIVIRREKRASRSCSVPAGFALVEFIASSTGGWPDATAGAPRGGGAGGVELRGGLLRRIYCGRHHISHNCGAPWFARPFVGLPRLQIRGQFKVLELVHQLKELAALRALGDGAACAHRISQKESASQEGTTPRTPEALSAAVHPVGCARARARAPIRGRGARAARAGAFRHLEEMEGRHRRDEGRKLRGAAVSARDSRAFSRAPARSRRTSWPSWLRSTVTNCTSGCEATRVSSSG